MNNRMNDDYAIDLAQYYGVSFSGSDKSSASTNYHPNLPSLEQIASYNLQNARAEAERQRADEEKQRADEEKQRADEEKQRADAEKQLKIEAEERANALEEEVQRLRKLLKSQEQK